MPNWCDQTLTITGPESDRIAFLSRAGATLEFRHWIPCPSDENENYDWRLDNWNCSGIPSPGPGFHLESDSIMCFYETAFTPAIPIIHLMSREFPSLSFNLYYSIESSWDAGTLNFKNGEMCLIEHQVGWFRLAKDDEPVHHYISRFNSEDPKVIELISSGTLFRPETAKTESEFAFRCVPDELSVRPDSWILRYTVDEPVYLKSCYDRASDAYITGRSYRDCGGVQFCECRIALTEAEAAFLATFRPPTDNDDYLNRERVLYRDLYFLLTGRYLTTRQELTFLLCHPDLNDERRHEIQQAMKSPRWLQEWPVWRQIIENAS